MADIAVILPDGNRIDGESPIVIIGPNGSGKTRISRRLQTEGVPIEFTNALRNTRISQNLPAVSKTQATNERRNMSNTARNQPWELVNDFDYTLAQLLADDSDSARAYRSTHKAGGALDEIAPTALETAEKLWEQVFPGRSVEWTDWAPVVTNEITQDGEPHQVASYSAMQMSDGERAALYLLAKVLLTEPGTLLVVDEPETHFHAELAVRLWDALEAQRDDLRFVYVTHDLTFALSREPADFLLADPVKGLTPVSVEEGVPADIRKGILGAASFSYYASRVIFCEGEDHSEDKKVFAAWFGGRDTVVQAVGSAEAVRKCVDAFNAAHLVDNLDAQGIVDRDYWSDEELAAMEQDLNVLAWHEIEGLICEPEIAGLLAEHLGRDLQTSIAQVINAAISDHDERRVAMERAKLRIRTRAAEHATKTPTHYDDDSLASHYREMADALSKIDTTALFQEELERVHQARTSGDTSRILAVFPSKPIAGRVAQALGSSKAQLIELVSKALTATADDQLHSLGLRLIPLLETKLPARAVEERVELLEAPPEDPA